ncbi:MAG TPA: hypothetical protein VI916_09110 [Acidimicrobiia bacterium]|nr:hypothetical protein [Acidimicrobiia bacterium]
MVRIGRLCAAAGLVTVSLGIAIGVTSTTAGACPVDGQDGTLMVIPGGVTPIGADSPSFFNLDGEPGDEVTKPNEVSNEQWPGDTDGVANNERNKTVYVDDRQYINVADSTLGPDSSGLEDTTGLDINILSLEAGDEEGLWLYVETNSYTGLQRGGRHVAFGLIWEDLGAPDEFDKVIQNKVEVLAPNPDSPAAPEGLYLFDGGTPEDPSDDGFPAGGSLQKSVENNGFFSETDPCVEQPQPGETWTVPDAILL